MKAFFLLLLVSACSSHRRETPYLLSHTKQKHNVAVYSKDGILRFKAQSFAVYEGATVHLTLVSPLGFTLLKADLSQLEKAKLLYLSPSLSSWKSKVNLLLEKLNELFWARQGDLKRSLRVLSYFEDGSARDLEWDLATQRVTLTVEIL